MQLLKHKFQLVLMSMLLVGSVAAPVFAVVSPVYAADESTQEIKPKEDDCKVAKDKKLTKDNCGIIKLIVVVTNIMAGIAATVIVATLTFAGIQYSSAGADPSKVQAAKKRMYNALLALMLLIFGYAILQWLVPGGIF